MTASRGTSVVLGHGLDARHLPRRDDRPEPFLDLERHVEGVPRGAFRHGGRRDPRVPESVRAIERLESVTVRRRVSVHVSSGLEKAARARLERAVDVLSAQAGGTRHLHGGDRPSLPFLDRERHELLVRRRLERDVHLRARVAFLLIRAPEPVLQELERVLVRGLAPLPGRVRVRAHHFFALARDLQDDARPDEEGVMRRDGRRGGVVRLVVEAHLRARVPRLPVGGREALRVLPRLGAAIGFPSLRFRLREQGRLVEGGERSREPRSFPARARGPFSTSNRTTTEVSSAPASTPSRSSGSK